MYDISQYTLNELGLKVILISIAISIIPNLIPSLTDIDFIFIYVGYSITDYTVNNKKELDTIAVILLYFHIRMTISYFMSKRRYFKIGPYNEVKIILSHGEDKKLYELRGHFETTDEPSIVNSLKDNILTIKRKNYVTYIADLSIMKDVNNIFNIISNDLKNVTEREYTVNIDLIGKCIDTIKINYCSGRYFSNCNIRYLGYTEDQEEKKHMKKRR